MKYVKQTGWKRLLAAGGYAVEGLVNAFKTEDAFRQEVLLAAVLIPVSFFIAGTAAEHCLLIASVLFVLLMELLNTAIETVVERISDDIHPLSKRAKDIGSAAVFVSLINMVVIWAIILIM